MPAVLVALTAFGLNVSVSNAKSNYGPPVDEACASFNGTAPYQDQSCALCHAANIKKRVDPAWTWWETQNLTAFCPESVNQAPNGVIDSPTGNLTVSVGDSVIFAGTASDPENHNPLSFKWDLGGGAPGSTLEDPGSLTFNSAGTFIVTLTVTDNLGLSDPTPAKRTIVVNEIIPTCTDGDGDGYSTEGGRCGPVDCNDNDSYINPGAVESCTDGVDNNCNGLTDADDPVAQNCPGFEACLDDDGDMFSADGGICGPIDCDDFDALVNPGATEQCGDQIDNDCDGAIDTDDRECNGGDCIEQLFNEIPVEFNITKADWDDGDRKLIVQGDQAPGDARVILKNAITGDLLGSRTAEDDGKWKFEVEKPAMAPCRVRVEIDRQVAERDVNDAPSNCDSDASIHITHADWEAEGSRLRVQGDKSQPGAKVKISNMATGRLIGTVVVEDNGKWRYRTILKYAAQVPCRVQIEISGKVVVANIKNAPFKNCNLIREVKRE